MEIVMNNLKKEIIDILSNYAFDKKVLINANENSKIHKDLKINSARIVDIVLDVEEKYDIEIEDKELEKIITIADVINIIRKKSKS